MLLTWRSLSVDDAPAIAGLANRIAAADNDGWPITEDSAREEFSVPGFDPATDAVGVWSGDRLVANAFVHSRPGLTDGNVLVRLQLDVDPDHRDATLGRELLGWAETRATGLAAERQPGHPVRFRTSGGTDGSWTQRLLESAGYTPDNYFITMEVQLADWQDPGLESTAVAPDTEALMATLDAHNDAFRDHRNHSPLPAELWRHFLANVDARPGASRVVLDGSRVLAYAMVLEPHPGVAHIELVGTRREARGRGLARQVLVAVLRGARDAGLRTAELEVDSTSPTGADRLYTSIGFRPVRTISRYHRAV